MYYFYVLKSETNEKYYFGSTKDLKQRLQQHNKTQSISTKSGVPWSLIYYEAYSEKSKALTRERSMKHYGQSWRRLRERLEA